MLHLRRMGLLDTSVLTVTGQTLGENLDWWEDPSAATTSGTTCETRPALTPTTSL